MEGDIENFVKEGSKGIYSSRLLKEDDRIGNKYNTGEITLLHEKRSQEALVAVSYILAEISVKRVEQLKELKFHNKMLCGIYLNNIKLDSIDFQNTYLTAASLNVTSLNGAKLNYANLQGASLLLASLKDASLDWVHLEGASLRYTHLEGASLRHSHLEGASLDWVHLEGALIVNAQLQGAKMDNVDLSNAMLLDCNLYEATLKNIKSENVVFNDITDIGYIKDEGIRKKWLDDICQYMKWYDVKSFTRQMEAAWQAMENKKEPVGMDIIKTNSIVTKDSQGVYDISAKKSADIQKGLQGMVNEKGMTFLYNIRRSLSSLYMLTKERVNLVDELKKILDELIKSNEK